MSENFIVNAGSLFVEADPDRPGKCVAAIERNGAWYACRLGRIPEDPAKLAEWLAGDDLNLDDCPCKDALARHVIRSRRFIYEEVKANSKEGK